MGAWHAKIAKNRGDKWKENFMAGRMDAQLNPTVLRLARLKLNVHQEDIAKRLDLSESTYGSIERAKRLVKDDDAQKISKVLKQPVEKLFRRKGKKFIAAHAKPGI